MKLNIGISGVSGRIGQRLAAIIQADDDLAIAYGLVSQDSQYKQPEINIIKTCKKTDLWIDFSTPVAFAQVLSHCVASKTPLVTGTTGLSKQHFQELKSASLVVPIIWSANYAIAINLIQHFLSHYTNLCQTKVDITETHHLHKLDKPSGTAIALAKSIQPHGSLKQLNEDEFLLENIKIKSIRAAQVAGIHQINLTNSSEQISITHTATTPNIFAQGAVDVAKWLLQQEAGRLYSMQDYIPKSQYRKHHDSTSP